MKSRTHYRKMHVCIPVLVLCLLIGCQTALAADAAGDWRGTYDIAMKWFNFCLLAFLIIKFGRSPIKGFLAGQKDEVALEIKSLERQKAEVQAKIDDARTALAEGDARLASLKEKIFRQAEKEKARILAAAQEQSRMMIESAKQRVETRIQQARNTVMAEMVDAAVAAAMTRLPELITPEDDQKMLDRFMAEM